MLTAAITVQLPEDVTTTFAPPDIDSRLPAGRPRRGSASAAWRWRRSAVLACLLTTACLPESRLNDACRWTDDVTVLPPPGEPARRAHLVEDVRVAQWLGIRHGDVVVGYVFNDAHRAARAQCTEASLAEIRRRHGVSQAELMDATGVREPWIDAVAVFLPMAALFLVFCRVVVRHVLAGQDAGDRGFTVGVLVALSPITAGFGLGATHMWAWLVETMRLRDGHISYRAAYLPVAQHAWLVWGAGMVLFAAVAVAIVRRNDSVSSGGGRTTVLLRVPARRRR